MQPLKPGSLRAHLYRLLHGRAIREGKSVVLTREQLMGAFPRSREQHPALPESYDTETYVLTGDDDLRPVTP